MNGNGKASPAKTVTEPTNKRNNNKSMTHNATVANFSKKDDKDKEKGLKAREKSKPNLKDTNLTEGKSLPKTPKAATTKPEPKSLKENKTMKNLLPNKSTKNLNEKPENNSAQKQLKKTPTVRGNISEKKPGPEEQKKGGLKPSSTQSNKYKFK
jgi:hypothetical protein